MLRITISTIKFRYCSSMKQRSLSDIHSLAFLFSLLNQHKKHLSCRFENRFCSENDTRDQEMCKHEKYLSRHLVYTIEL